MHIKDIEGIGPKYGEKLTAAGIDEVEEKRVDDHG